MGNQPLIAVNTRLLQQKGSGIPYYIKKLYQSLLQTHEQILFFQTKGKITIGKTKIFPCSAHGIAGIFFDLLGVLWLIYKRKPIIFHGPSFILPLWKPKRCKYVLTVHDLSLHTMPGLYRFSFRIIYKLLLRLSVAKADAIVVVSEHTKKDLLHYYAVDPQKITVSYPGLNEIFLSEKISHRLLQEPYILSLTTHPKRKNILSVIEALALLKEHGQIITYVVVGIIGEKQKDMLLKKAAQRHVQDQLILRGYASEEELISLYTHAEVFIYPSFYEGFGFPIIEAMASKTLVITSNTSSMKELVQDSHFLVDPTCVEDIYAKLIYALHISDREKKKVIEHNYTFCQQFTREKSVQQYKVLFSHFVENM